MSQKSLSERAERVIGGFLLLAAISLMVLFLSSCQKDDPSPVVAPNPSVAAPSCYTVQSRLDNGETPWAIVESGVSMECLYGKLYFNGIVYLVDTVYGYAAVVAKPEEGFQAEWGCDGYMHADGWDVGQGAINDCNFQLYCNAGENDFSAFKNCRMIDHQNGDSSYWKLPTRGDLLLMHDNLATRGLGDFNPDYYYWSSSEWVSPFLYAWVVNVTNAGNASALKADTKHCRCNIYVHH